MLPRLLINSWLRPDFTHRSEINSVKTLPSFRSTGWLDRWLCSKYIIAEGSLEVKLPTIWRDGQAEVGRVREEKRREEKRREEKRREETRREEKRREEGGRRGKREEEGRGGKREEEGRGKREEGRWKREEGRGKRKREEGRRKKEEGRRKKEEGRRKKEEERRKKKEERRKKKDERWKMKDERRKKKEDRGEKKEERRSEKRREEKRRERLKGKKMQREKVKSRNTLFFPMIYVSGGPKSTKAVGAEPSGQMRDEKLHAVVARSTFRIQNVQNTPFSEHFWKLRWWKSARRCGAKHISKSKC